MWALMIAYTSTSLVRSIGGCTFCTINFWIWLRAASIELLLSERLLESRHPLVRLKCEVVTRDVFSRWGKTILILRQATSCLRNTVQRPLQGHQRATNLSTPTTNTASLITQSVFKVHRASPSQAPVVFHDS